MPSTTTYTWDEENRLTNITLPNGGNEAYTYAADSLRRSKSVNGQTTRFVWDAENLLQEQRDPQTIAHYTNQPDGYGPLLSQWRSDGESTPNALFNAVSFGGAVFNQSGNTSTTPISSFYGFDLSADTRVLTDENGSVSDQYINTAFGKPISHSGNTSNSYRFGGEFGYYQDSNDRSYVRARHYSNTQGRWISQDPIGFAGGDWNLYRYAENNSSFWIDPSGNYVVLIRGGKGHAEDAPQAFPHLANYIATKCRDCVIQPNFYWRTNYINRPRNYPPDEEVVYDVLCKIYRGLKTCKGTRASDKKNIWLYGHSYGGHIAGQIANPQSDRIREMKAKIQREYGVTFKRYVTAVGNAAAYPQHFSHVDYNLYSLSGDPQLVPDKRAAGEGRILQAVIGSWWAPSSYNTRQLEPEFFGTMQRYPKPAQKYWYSGGKDRVIQGPNAPAAVPGRNGVPRNYKGPLWFNHLSFDARQGLSSVPYYRNQMIAFITKYLLAGHPGCAK